MMCAHAHGPESSSADDPPHRDRRSARRDLARRRRGRRRTAVIGADRWRSARAPRSARTSSSTGAPASAATTASSSSARSAARRRTRSTRGEDTGSRSATATRSASSARSTAARRRMRGVTRVGTTTGSWPTCTSRTTAGRRPHHLRQQRHARRPRPGRRLGDPGRHDCVHQFCAIGAHCVHRRWAIVLTGRAAVRDLQRQSGGAARHQYRGPQAPRLRSRDDQRAAPRLQTLYKDGLTTAEAIQALAPLSAEATDADRAVALLRTLCSNSQRGIVR